MPWKQWAYLEKVSSADFQAYLQDQTCPVFTSTSQRDTQWPTPQKGARCITTDTMTTWLFDGAGWRNASPVGQLLVAPTALLTPDAGPGSTSLGTGSFSVPTQRRCKLEVHAAYAVITNASNNAISVTFTFDALTAFRCCVTWAMPVGGGAQGAGIMYATLAAGSHTYTVTCANSSAAATARFTPGQVSVLDYGQV